MKQVMTIFATALLATSLLSGQAMARGGGGGGFGGGHAGGMGGGFGGGHIGGLGGTHIGGIGGGEHIGTGIHTGTGIHVGTGIHAGGIIGRVDGGGREHIDGFHHHAMHRFDRFYPGYGYDLSCYDWYLLHPNNTTPPYCG